MISMIYFCEQLQYFQLSLITILSIWCNFILFPISISGYIGSESFLNTVLQVVNKLRSINPELIYGENIEDMGLFDIQIKFRWSSYLALYNVLISFIIFSFTFNFRPCYIDLAFMNN